MPDSSGQRGTTQVIVPTSFDCSPTAELLHANINCPVADQNSMVTSTVPETMPGGLR